MSNGSHEVAAVLPAEEPEDALTLDTIDTLDPLLLDPLRFIIATACAMRAAVASAPSPLIICTCIEITAGMLWTDSTTDHKVQGDLWAAIAQSGTRGSRLRM